jgi:hypothetical protein
MRRNKRCTRLHGAPFLALAPKYFKLAMMDSLHCQELLLGKVPMQ